MSFHFQFSICTSNDGKGRKCFVPSFFASLFLLQSKCCTIVISKTWLYTFSKSNKCFFLTELYFVLHYHSPTTFTQISAMNHFHSTRCFSHFDLINKRTFSFGICLLFCLFICFIVCLCFTLYSGRGRGDRCPPSPPCSPSTSTPPPTSSATTSPPAPLGPRGQGGPWRDLSLISRSRAGLNHHQCLSLSPLASHCRAEAASASARERREVPPASHSQPSCSSFCSSFSFSSASKPLPFLLLLLLFGL